MNTFQKYNFNSKEKKMHFKNRKHPPSHSEVLKSRTFCLFKDETLPYFKQTNNDAYYKTLCLHHPEVDNQDSGHTLGHVVCISQRNTESHRPHSWCPLKRQTDHLDCPQKVFVGKYGLEALCRCCFEKRHICVTTCDKEDVK